MAPGSASRAVAAGGGPDRPPGVGATGAARHADRSRRVAALALFAGALAVRAIAWARTAVLFDDGPQFLAIAAALREGDWSTALAHPYHPLYPIAVAALSPGAGDPEAVAAGLSIVCGGLAVLAFFLWLDDAFDRRVAVVGGLLLALHPFAVEFSSDVQSDGLYLALFLGAFASIARALRTRRLRPAALGGALAGAAYLTRPEGLGLIAVAGVVLAASAIRDRRAARGAAAVAAVLALSGAVVAAPYLVELRRDTGTWQLTRKKSLSALAGLETAVPPGAPARLAPPAALPRAGDPAPPHGRAARWLRAGHELQKALLSAFRLELLPFLAFGLWLARGRPGPRAVWVFGVAGVYAVVLAGLALGAGYVSRRHALPPLVPMLGYAALGLVGLSDRLVARAAGGRPVPAWVTGAVCAGVLAALFGARDLAPRRLDRLAERRAAEWVRARTDATGAVAAGRPRVAYYAGRPYVPLPSDPPEGMLAYLAARGARFVVVDEAKLDDHGGLRQASGSGLATVHRERAAGRTALVLERAPSDDRAAGGPR